MTDGIIGSVVLRHMKRSPHFSRSTSGVSAELSMDLDDGEVIVGTYTNPPPWDCCQLVFTNTAIRIVDNEQLVEIPWIEIVDYEPLDPNASIDGVRLRTRDGIRFIRIAGAYGPEGKFKDAFNLAMVLRSILDG
jgi:hypothetical protein